DGVTDRAGAADRARRAVEAGREEAVPGGVDRLAAEARELAPDRGVVLRQEGRPRAAELRGPGGRVDEIGEENGREDAPALDRARSRTSGSDTGFCRRGANARSSWVLSTTSASQLWVTRSYSSRVGTHGKSGARTKRGFPWNSTSAKTRSGYVAAKRIASAAPSTWPRSAARSTPTASITARMSSIRSSSEGTPLTRSDAPLPRLSKRMTRIRWVRWSNPDPIDWAWNSTDGKSRP